MVGIYVADILSCVFFDVLHQVVVVSVAIIYGKYYMMRRVKYIRSSSRIRALKILLNIIKIQVRLIANCEVFTDCKNVL